MIRIINRKRISTNQLGEKCLLPGTLWTAQVFPTLVKLTHPELAPIEVRVEIPNGYRRFATVQDLERRRVELYACGNNDEIRFFYLVREDQIVLKVKSRLDIDVTVKGKKHVVVDKTPIILGPAGPTNAPQTVENLFLGVSKQLKWYSVKERRDLAEQLPLLFHLGQLTPKQAEITNLKCDDEESFHRLISCGYQSMNVPTKQDLFHQSYDWGGLPESVRAEDLPYFTYTAIRSLFVKEVDGEIHILPNHFREFHTGKMTQVAVGPVHLSFEWSKKRLRRVEVFSTEEKKLRLVLPKEIKRYRLGCCESMFGRNHTPDSEPLLRANTKYVLDRFKR